MTDNRELREEIDYYVYCKARDESEDKNGNRDYKKYNSILHNAELCITVVWDRYDKYTNKSTEDTDYEYSFIGTYPDWLIHISTCFYPHVGESTDWIKVKEGQYKVTYESYN